MNNTTLTTAEIVGALMVETRAGMITRRDALRDELFAIRKEGDTFGKRMSDLREELSILTKQWVHAEFVSPQFKDLVKSVEGIYPADTVLTSFEYSVKGHYLVVLDTFSVMRHYQLPTELSKSTARIATINMDKQTLDLSQYSDVVAVVDAMDALNAESDKRDATIKQLEEDISRVTKEIAAYRDSTDIGIDRINRIKLEGIVGAEQLETYMAALQPKSILLGE